MSHSTTMTLLGHLSGLSVPLPSDTLRNLTCQRSPLPSSSRTQVQLFPSLKWVCLFHHFHSSLGRQLNKWWMKNGTFPKTRSNSGSVSIHFRLLGGCLFPWFVKIFVVFVTGLLFELFLVAVVLFGWLVACFKNLFELVYPALNKPQSSVCLFWVSL